MGFFVTRSGRPLKGVITLPGDKSIAHRAAMLAGLCDGATIIRNFPSHEDASATVRVLREFGVKISYSKKNIIVRGSGLFGFKEPAKPVSAGESGTTFRLMLGILSGQLFDSTLTAAPSLARRPMLRVTAPLRLMGAKISARRSRGEEYPPVSVTGGCLIPVTYKLPVASAQVKSAVLLAGLYAKGITTVVEQIPSRDHTERMLRAFKAFVSRAGKRVSVRGGQQIVSPGELLIPGDISSAAFFIVAALLLSGSAIKIKGVGLNPTRTGIIGVLRRMNGYVRSKVTGGNKGEPYGDITVRFSRLKAVIVNKKEIPMLIDELPVLMVAACFAKGRTVFKGVGELRAKETDRIRSMIDNLLSLGANIKSVKSGKSEDVIITGTGRLAGARVKSYGDHRTAMSMAVAGMVASGRTFIDDMSCVAKSFPEFTRVLGSAIQDNTRKVKTFRVFPGAAGSGR